MQMDLLNFLMNWQDEATEDEEENFLLFSGSSLFRFLTNGGKP